MIIAKTQLAKCKSKKEANRKNCDNRQCVGRKKVLLGKEEVVENFNGEN